MEAQIRPVGSLAELRSLANTQEPYRRLMLMASRNLGGPDDTQEKAYQWLVVNALETNEEGVVEEVNGCIPLLN